MLTVDIVCTDPAHPLNPWLERWAAASADRADTQIHRQLDTLRGGDFLFLLACQQIVRAPVRARYRHTLVQHGSALPRGRGMSPPTWQILEGANEITVTMLEAADAVDEGAIWHQTVVHYDGTEVHGEIHAKISDAQYGLLDWALAHHDSVRPRPQEGEPTYYRRRVPEDSRIDPLRPLAESFDLLRVADPERYPAFFEYRGQKYRLRIDKL
jgi:methionyl-tRNA formyltransferase